MTFGGAAAALFFWRRKNGMQERTQRLIGEDGIAALRAARVILFGVGGVGGAVAEALLRAGVGHACAGGR